MRRLNQKVTHLSTESRDTPMVRAARFDPPPTSTLKSLWITRKVRVYKKLETTTNTVITVDDVKTQSSSGAFKVSRICAWTPGSLGTQFFLGEATWLNDTTTEMAYLDIAPPGHMPGVCYNIPDQLSTMVNTGTVAVLSCQTIGAQLAATNSILVADVTIRYQI